MQLRYNTEYDDDLPDWAYIEVTPDFLKEIEGKITEFGMLSKKYSDLAYLDFWDYSPLYFRNPGGLEEADAFDKVFETVCQNGYTLLETLPGDISKLDYPDFRSACERLVVGSSGFYWSCHEKHTDIEVYSVRIPLEDVKKIFKEAA